jgi:hypothetical protein
MSRYGAHCKEHAWMRNENIEAAGIDLFRTPQTMTSIATIAP